MTLLTLTPTLLHPWKLHSRTPPQPIRCSSDTPPAPLSLDRRGLLLGLGGLYAAAPMIPPSASAIPDPAILHTHNPHCHLTKSPSTPLDFILPSPSIPKRVRRPAHLVDSTFIAQYSKGLQKMIDLPSDHPWNLENHAAHHDIHSGWLFFPWHRLYIYFFERAIANLIDDDAFALPYWNFDSPDGMSIPALFTSDPSSPLYNPTRDPAHLPPTVLDLQYAYSSGNQTARDHDDQVMDNLWQIGMAFRQSLGAGGLFSGWPVREGETLYGGRIENLHKAIHQWVGPPGVPYMDMGNPHTTAKDPIFYSLHANMDRLWDIYKGFRGNRDDFSDPEWLNITFTFHDENGQPVRAKVSDALSSDKLGYTYEQVPLPWASRLPITQPQTTIWGRAATPASFMPIGEFGAEPRTLKFGSSPVRVVVSRPKVPLSKREDDEQVEVLHIKGIDVIPGQPARFDIFVASAESDLTGGHGYGAYTGNFIKPHVIHPPNHMKGTLTEHRHEPQKDGLKLGIAPILEAIDAEDDENLVVTLVPRDGMIILDGVGIELLQRDGSLLI